MSLREQKKQWTRQAIEEAALGLFLEQGFDETPVEAIAEAAGVSRSTFFRYFETKEAAFFAGQEARITRFQELLEAATGEPLERVRVAFRTVAAEYQEHRSVIMAQTRIIRSSRNLMGYDQQLDVRWEEAIRDTLIEGGRGPRNAMLVAGAITGMARALFREWINGGGQASLVALADDAFAVLSELFQAREER